MALNLAQPDRNEDVEALADAVDLAPADDAADASGPETSSRLRALWDRIMQEGTPPGGPRHRALTLPTLRPYFLGLGALRAVVTGTVVICRSCWALARASWAYGVLLARKAEGKAEATEDKADGDAAEKAPAKSKASAKEGKKGGKGEKEGKDGKKKAAPPPKRRLTGDALLGGLVLGGMAVLFVTNNVVPAIANAVADLGTYVADHPVTALRGAGLALIIFVPVAWLVGCIAGEDSARSTGDHHGGEAADDAEAIPPEDQETDQGSGETEPCGEGGDASPADAAEAARIRVYAWVRGSIGGLGNGRAVHLRELLLDAQQEDGGEALTMADLRAALEAHGIPVRDGVKAPASDHAGATRNRPGVHRDDLPQAFTPLPTPGSNLIRLLPTYQATDQQ